MIEGSGPVRPTLVRLAAFRRKGRVPHGQRRMVVLARIEKGKLVLPRGLLFRVRQVAGKELVVEDRRLRFAPRSFRWTGRLYPYQQVAVEAIYRQQGGVLVSAPGSGKTHMGMALAAAWGQPTLWLTHTTRLAEQALSQARRLFDLPSSALGFVGEGSISVGSHMTVAMVQTLGKRPDLVRYFAPRIGSVFVDECFPAGTLVDGRPIESIRVGDMVSGVCDRTMRIHRRMVTKVMRRPCPDRLIRVSAGSYEIVCTPNHPVWTARGWVAAYSLVPGDQVSVLRPAGRYDGEAEELRGRPLLRVQDACRPLHQEQEGLLPPDGPCVLLSNLRRSSQKTGILANDGSHQPEVRLTTYEGAESYVASWSKGEGPGIPPSNRPQATGSGREWEGPDGTSDASSEGTWVAGGGCHSDAQAAGEWVSGLLQGGHWEPGTEDCNRDRRTLPWGTHSQAAGQKEGSFLAVCRVDRVEVLERGGDNWPAGLCGDGYVYNLEVDDIHTYFANGILVHNCHHTPADTYLRIIGRFPAAYRCGLSATPDRTDGLGPMMVAVLGGRVIVPLKVLLAAGRVMRPHVFVANSQFRVAGSHLGWAELERLRARDVGRNALILDIIRWLIARRRKVLVLVTRKDHARLLAKALTSVGIQAYAVIGELTPERRDRYLAAMEQGKAVCVATRLADEGLDIPVLDALVLASAARSPVTLDQQMGRVMRVVPGKPTPLVVDIADVHVRTYARQVRKRLAHYGSLGLEVGRLRRPATNQSIQNPRTKTP